MPAPVVALEEEQRLGVSGPFRAVAARRPTLPADHGDGADGQLVVATQSAQETLPFEMELAKGTAEAGA